MSGYPNKCGPCGPGRGSYTPSPNCWGGPAYNVKCSQTVFCASNCCGTNSVNVTSSTEGLVTDGTCSSDWILQIQGSGLSISSICSANSTSPSPITAVAGLICSCPTNFTTVATLIVYPSPIGDPLMQWTGTMNWSIC
jgi:hypothetical protein